MWARLEQFRARLDRRNPVLIARLQITAMRAEELMRNTVRTGDRAGLTAAIDLHRQALDICPSDHPAQAGILANLAAALYVRFEWSGRRADLDEAVVAGRAALAALRPGDPNLAGWLSNLGRRCVPVRAVGQAGRIWTRPSAWVATRWLPAHPTIRK